MIRVGIVGATGYTGVELVRLLQGHRNAEITSVVSHSFVGMPFSDIYPSMRGFMDAVCEDLDIDRISEKCDVVITALNEGISEDVIPAFMEKKVKVIDLSAYLRYNDPEIYNKWYHTTHKHPHLLKKSVYGLPELHREEIRKAELVGNPGCYTTCSILALAPLLSAGLVETNNIIIDAKSGVTGAGRKASLPNIFTEVDENFKAYGVSTHRHTSEIEQELSLLAGTEVLVSFTPHLVPMKRGILATCYANLSDRAGGMETGDLIEVYRKFYKGEYFVRIHEAGSLPETKFVCGSNFIDIGLVVDSRLNRVVVVSAIDNLIKGASGQAIQNMNILFGIDEKEGLTTPAWYL